MRITVLGSGTSTGVPLIGCRCDVCRSDDPKDKRTRASLLVTPQADAAPILFDTGPEVRLQLVRHDVDAISSVIYTHIHADHSHGFDDLRVLYFRERKPLPCYMPEQFIEEFKTRFAYAFSDTGYQGLPPQIDLRALSPGPFRVGSGDELEAFALPHGNVTTFGYRIGPFAYLTDFKVVPEQVRQRLRGKVKCIVASGIRFREHPTHSSIPETVQLFEDLKVERGVISHLSHEVSHQAVAAQLPSGIELAYDGMIIDV